jgi:hypothetical protein
LGILVAGDLHGEFRTLQKALRHLKPDITLQVGDFGYWPYEESYSKFSVNGTEFPVYFCDGNHERLDLLIKNKEVTEVCRNVFYQPRGSTLTLPDGRTVLFLGGAASIDKEYRTPGFDWFPEEIPSYVDLPDQEIDIVISHTCPRSLHDRMLLEVRSSFNLIDPTGYLLEHVLEKYRPSLWYFGHWHKYAEGTISGTKWVALDCFIFNGGYVWLP